METQDSCCCAVGESCCTFVLALTSLQPWSYFITCLVASCFNGDSTALEMSACEKSYQRYSSSWLLWKLHFSFYSAFSMGLIHTLAFLSFHPTHAPLCLQHNPSGHHHPPLKPHTHTQQVTTCQLWLFMKIYFYDCSDGELLAFCLWFWILFVWTTCRISVIVSNKNPSIRKVADLAYLNISVVKALM